MSKSMVLYIYCQGACISWLMSYGMQEGRKGKFQLPQLFQSHLTNPDRQLSEIPLKSFSSYRSLLDQLRKQSTFHPVSLNCPPRPVTNRIIS